MYLFCVTYETSYFDEGKHVCKVFETCVMYVYGYCLSMLQASTPSGGAYFSVSFERGGSCSQQVKFLKIN